MNPDNPNFIGPKLPPVQGQQPAPQSAQPVTQVASTVDPFVRQGQTFLSANGFNPGPIDGLMGPKTSAGIQAFQTAQSLPTTGQFDQATRNAIANFKPEPVPMPEISNEVDVTQLEGPTAQPFTPAQPQPSAFSNITAGIESYLSNLDKRIADLSNQAYPTIDAINQLLGQEGQTSRVLQAEQEAGLPALRNQLVSIQGQIGEELASLRAGQQALESQGAIRSTTGLTRRQEQLQQQSTNRILALQSAAEVLQGNISNAENYITRLAQAETENQRNQLEARMFNLQQIQRQAEQLGDERSALAAEARQLQVSEAMRLLDEQTAERTEARQIALSAIPRGADSTEVANFLAGNPTVADAIARFGQDLQAPTPQEALEMENARLQNAVLSRELNQVTGGEMAISPNDAIAIDTYAQEYAATGKIPSGMPKEFLPYVALAAKATPQEPGRVVSNITGLPPQNISPTEQSALAAMKDMADKIAQMKEIINSGKLYAGLPGKIGGIIPSATRKRYNTLRDEFVDLLARDRTGAVINKDERVQYEKLVPTYGQFSLGAGRDPGVQINNLEDIFTRKLDTELSSRGVGIVGYMSPHEKRELAKLEAQAMQQ